MRPVRQTTITPGGGGNCVAACIASIFELPISDVFPDVPNGGGYQEICRWTESRYPALTVCSKDLFNITSWTPDRRNLAEVDPPQFLGWWVAYVESPRAAKKKCYDCYGLPTQHAVVMRHNRLMWDPHPHGEVDGVGFARGMLWWELRHPERL